jgi:hypothetical protein
LIPGTDRQGQPRVADFGLARLVEQAGGAVQGSSVVVGAWLGTDLLLATVLLIIDGQPLTPLTAVCPVLIAASGL